ncbi:GNAT family N-acetyltransferase [Sphingomonas sp. ID0503]|uniref:GNAT family N-acetyltransferase n=1 Tax=Sphingomonas sp. ID0503 TaxID=3399691 RepID=UPI003AFACA90
MSEALRILPGTVADLNEVMVTMAEAFDPRFGEAWTAAQCRGMLGTPGLWLILARHGDEPAGFALARVVVDEAELLLIAVRPSARRLGTGSALVGEIARIAAANGARRLMLEMRDGNPAARLYSAAGFAEIGRRPGYYTGREKERFDAITLGRSLDN